MQETPSEASVLLPEEKALRKAGSWIFPVFRQEQILHELPQEQRRCPQCGGELHACGHSVLRRELTYIPARYKLYRAYPDSSTAAVSAKSGNQ
ncbi:MAG: IS66 family transposase zinc-finger binding domain-containing protein [Oscillospiraceae bacterium]